MSGLDPSASRKHGPSSLAALMRKKLGKQTPEEIEAEKAKRGSMAKVMDDVLAARGCQPAAKGTGR